MAQFYDPFAFDFFQNPGAAALPPSLLAPNSSAPGSAPPSLRCSIDQENFYAAARVLKPDHPTARPGGVGGEGNPPQPLASALSFPPNQHLDPTLLAAWQAQYQGGSNTSDGAGPFEFPTSLGGESGGKPSTASALLDSRGLSSLQEALAAFQAASAQGAASHPPPLDALTFEHLASELQLQQLSLQLQLLQLQEAQGLGGLVTPPRPSQAASLLPTAPATVPSKAGSGAVSPLLSSGVPSSSLPASPSYFQGASGSGGAQQHPPAGPASLPPVNPLAAAASQNLTLLNVLSGSTSLLDASHLRGAPAGLGGFAGSNGGGAGVAQCPGGSASASAAVTFGGTNGVGSPGPGGPHSGPTHGHGHAKPSHRAALLGLNSGSPPASGALLGLPPRPPTPVASQQGPGGATHKPHGLPASAPMRPGSASVAEGYLGLGGSVPPGAANVGVPLMSSSEPPSPKLNVATAAPGAQSPFLGRLQVQRGPHGHPGSPLPLSGGGSGGSSRRANMAGQGLAGGPGLPSSAAALPSRGLQAGLGGFQSAATSLTGSGTSTPGLGPIPTVPTPQPRSGGLQRTSGGAAHAKGAGKGGAARGLTCGGPSTAAQSVSASLSSLLGLEPAGVALGPVPGGLMPHAGHGATGGVTGALDSVGLGLALAVGGALQVPVEEPDVVEAPAKIKDLSVHPSLKRAEQVDLDDFLAHL